MVDVPSYLASFNGIDLLTWPDLASLRPLNVKYVGGWGGSRVGRTMNKTVGGSEM